VGVNAEFGRFNRLFIGASFGSQRVDFDVDALMDVSSVNTVVRPGLAIGYKGTAKCGLLCQLYGRIAHLMNDRHSHGSIFAPMFGFGLGYEFKQPMGHEGVLLSFPYHAVDPRRVWARRVGMASMRGRVRPVGHPVEEDLSGLRRQPE
jgi:hypothetical protein